MELLIPSWAELAGWGGVLITTLLFLRCGRLIIARRAAPETALVAGWGGACLVLVLWGVTSASLLLPGLVVIALGLAGYLPALAPEPPAWRSMGRVLTLALPLLGVMASARPSQPDTFLNLLPNAAYLWDHRVFPADGGAA